MENTITEKGNNILDNITEKAQYKYDVKNNPSARLSYMNDTPFSLTVKIVEEIISSVRYYISNMDTGSYNTKQELKNLTDLRYELINYKNPQFPKSKSEIQDSIKLVDDSIEKVKGKMREHDDLKAYLNNALFSLELDVKVAKLKL